MQAVGTIQTAGVRGAAGETSCLSMYNEQPTEELTLQDFEILALDRLKVLKAIESAKARGIKGAELNTEIRQLSLTHLGGDIGSLTKPTPDVQRKDMVSHHILRLAYCQSEEKRRWFLTQEVALFRYRLERHTSRQQEAFMRKHGLSFESIPSDEQTQFGKELQRMCDIMMQQDRVQMSPADFVKVPFLQALELVSHRRVFVQNGIAYVPRDRLMTIIITRFRASLSRGLAFAYKALPTILRDERLGDILVNMSQAYVGRDYSKGQGALAGATVRAGDIMGLAESSFPMCMEHLQRGLSTNHHLRHAGRMQYGLFLKGIGLGLEEALVFWQNEFTKSMSPDDFLKKYAYNIRHNYGKEGKRADYTPYSCQRIIMGSAPGGGEYHGCPYKHWDTEHLHSALTKSGLPGAAVADVMASVRTKDFQVACRKQWEARYGLQSLNVGNHPNAYVEEAQAALRGDHPSQKGSSAAAAGASTATGFNLAPTTEASAAAPAAAPAVDAGAAASDAAPTAAVSGSAEPPGDIQ